MFLNEKLHDDVIFLMMEQQSLQCCHVYLDSYHHVCDPLGSPGLANNLLRGAQFFKTMLNGFQLSPTHFCRGSKYFAGTPLVTGLAITAS